MKGSSAYIALCGAALVLSAALAGCTKAEAPPPTAPLATPVVATPAPIATPAPETASPALEPTAPALAEDQAIRTYIEENLPESYLNADRYQLDISGQDGRYTASIVMDMTADGSDFTEYAEEDYWMLAELESGYVAGTCLSDLPAPTDLSMLLLMGEAIEITAEKPYDSETYALTWQGERMEFS